MQNFLVQYYDWIKVLHIISVISWMAGLLYLPRLFVYHAGAEVGSELSETLKTMEYRLFKFIMNPAMIATWVFGLSMVYSLWDIYKMAGWFHIKFLLVFMMTGAHHVMLKHLKCFAADKNQKSAKFFRILNEVPTILMIMIVVLVIIKPF